MPDSVRQRRREKNREVKMKIMKRSCEQHIIQRRGRFAVAIMLIIACLCYYYIRSVAKPFDVARLSEEEKVELRKAEPAIIANLTAHSPYRLGRFCDSGGDCFAVEQRYWMDRSRLHAQRLITYENNRKMSLTIATLKTPEMITPHHLVHERWPVDTTILTFWYNLIQCTAGFALEGLSFARSDSHAAKQRVLQIGMGGGSATTYMRTMPVELHIDVIELEPAVYDAAKRWFDFPNDDPNVTVHIMDGVVFVKEAAARGVTYDSLMLDASSNAPNASIVAPHEAFLKEDVLAAMSKVIGSTGVFSVNLFMPNDQERLQAQVIRQFEAHFRSCSALKILTEGQKFLMCTNRVGFGWSTQRPRMMKNLKEFDERMGTAVVPYLDRLNPVLG